MPRRLVPIGPALLLVAAAAVLAAGTYLAIGRGGTQLETTVLQQGLAWPWDIAFTPDGRMLVTERPGRVRLYASAQAGAELLSTLTIPDVRAESESGTMGIAVDVDFVPNPFAYVCTSVDPDGPDGEGRWVNQLLRLRIGPGSEISLDGVLFGELTDERPGELMRAAIHHNGCAVEMDLSRHLWLTMGDGNTGSGANLAQDPTSPNGKVLRLNADGSIPDDNPVLPGATTPSAAWSMGHRNPQGIAISADGLVYEVEHGTDENDELNRIVPGGNYGYGCVTGFGTDGPATTLCDGSADYLDPLWASGNPTLATSGIALLPAAWGDWAGDLVVTTLKESDMRRFRPDGDGTGAALVETLLDNAYGRLRAAVIGPDGALYLTTSNDRQDDVIIRVSPPS
jgi:glucose/arabinose dehydrogenase